jgi:hypothetical protein
VFGARALAALPTVRREVFVAVVVAFTNQWRGAATHRDRW